MLRKEHCSGVLLRQPAGQVKEMTSRSMIYCTHLLRKCARGDCRIEAVAFEKTCWRLNLRKLGGYRTAMAMRRAGEKR